MSKRIEPPVSRARNLYPDASPETLAWIVEKARGIVRDGQGGAVGWEWGTGDDEDFEPDPENKGPVARVFNDAGETVDIVTQGD
jgi:hypothetical protein